MVTAATFRAPALLIKAVTTLDVLDRHCADVGRPPEEIERTVTTALHDGERSGELAERCHALADLGVQYVVVIARGRPLIDADLNCVAGAADQLAGLAHTPG
jgi:hypothetical protein